MLDLKDVPAIGFGPDDLWYMKGYYHSHNTILQKVYGKTLGRVLNKTVVKSRYVNAIAESVRLGYKLIDFSASYGDGSLIAKGIKRAGGDRSDVLITTRVSNTAQFNDGVEDEFLRQLKGFDTDYMDILMFHWPVTGHYEETWLKMIRMKEKGLCRMLGVANCNIHHLKRLYEVSGIFPEVNQVEIHPLFAQIELRKFCRENHIWVQAYSPTARQDDRLFNPKPLKKLAAKYNKSITQLILKWHIQNGITPIIRSLNPRHLESDLDIFDFNISEEDMRLIDGLNINSRIRYDPDNCDFHSL